MIKLEAIKDGLGNIMINEDSFEFLLSCLDNQKFIDELSEPTKTENQNVIDSYNHECRKILHQRYIFETEAEGYYLTKRYRYQDKITPWSGEDANLCQELFKDTIEKPKNLKPITNEPIKEGTVPLGVDEDGWIVIDPGPQPWLIERALRFDGDYLTISEDGKYNRPWKEEEIKKIQEAFEGYEVKPNNFYKEELWKEQLNKMDDSIIEQHLRKLKLRKL